jgi:hypothetical protein
MNVADTKIILTFVAPNSWKLPIECREIHLQWHLANGVVRCSVVITLRCQVSVWCRSTAVPRCAARHVDVGTFGSTCVSIWSRRAPADLYTSSGTGVAGAAPDLCEEYRRALGTLADSHETGSFVPLEHNYPDTCTSRPLFRRLCDPGCPSHGRQKNGHPSPLFHKQAFLMRRPMPLLAAHVS